MTRDVRVLSAPATAAGLALSGLPVTAARNPDEAAARCAAWLEDPEVGVVLLEQRLHDQLPDELRQRFSRRPLPMVVPFPGPEAATSAAGADAYVVELLRQVIGYRVRIR